MWTQNVDEAWRLQNKYRQLHDVKPFVWDVNCAIAAQTWADELIRTNTFTHGMLTDKKGRRMGQNLAWAGGPHYRLEKFIDLWYNESKLYNYKQPQYTPKTGHFTQMVWNATTGCGFGVGISSQSIILVANYYPPGNVQGGFANNVFPPLAYS